MKADLNNTKLEWIVFLEFSKSFPLKMKRETLGKYFVISTQHLVFPLNETFHFSTLNF